MFADTKIYCTKTSFKIFFYRLSTCTQPINCLHCWRQKHKTTKHKDIFVTLICCTEQVSIPDILSQSNPRWRCKS